MGHNDGCCEMVFLFKRKIEVSGDFAHASTACIQGTSSLQHCRQETVPDAANCQIPVPGCTFFEILSVKILDLS